jgi:asparagine synthetase B (glutamine-hydrolysing)
MCGIATFFARESVPDYKYFDTIFHWSEKRGHDGFGVVIIPRKNNKKPESYYSLCSYSTCKMEVRKFIEENIDVGSLVIAISRAAPETEPPSSHIKILQPIKNSNCVLAHNGAVSNKIHRELQQWASQSNEYKFKTENDSESIIAAYTKYKWNMKNAMEYLSGGFAFVMYDNMKDMLYVVNDFKPLAHGYIRGVGFFITSDNDAIGEVLYDHLGVSRDGMFLWENYYHHYLSGYAIREIDLQSGFMRKQSYSPRFKVGNTFDSNSNIMEG